MKFTDLDVVLLCGGRGTRLSSVSTSVKDLMERQTGVVDKPI